MPEQGERSQIYEQEAVNAAEREKQRAERKQQAKQGQRITNTAHSAEPVKSDKLLPFLNAAHERYTFRIAVLNRKAETRASKITKNSIKKEMMEAKANRLTITNDMLRRVTAGTRLEAAANAMIGRNQQRIEKIRKVKIPKIMDKISGHQEKIAALQKKCDAQERKAEKCVALSNVITSFVILDPVKRRAQFSQSMDTLHRITRESLTAKIEKYTERNAVLQKKIDIGNLSANDRNRLSEHLIANMQKIQEADTRLKKLDFFGNLYVKQPAERQDMLQSFAERQLDAAAQRGETRINPLTETFCSETAERVAEQSDRVLGQLLTQTGYTQVFDNPFAKDGFTVLRAPKGKETAFDGIELAIEYLSEAAAAQQLRTVFCIEQFGEKRYYEAQNAGIEDIIRIGKAAHPVVEAAQIGQRISEAEYAAIEQSEKLSASVEINADSHTATIYEVNQGNGGIREENRTDQNIQLRTVSLTEEQLNIKPEQQKFNPEYFKSIPRADRLTDTRSTDAARKIMDALHQQGIPFSAVFRENGTASITVNQKQHGAVYLNAVRAAGEPLPVQQKQQDMTVRTPEAAVRITEALNHAGVHNSSVRQGKATVIVTAQQDRSHVNAVISDSEQQHRKQFINPETYKQIPQEERFTRRMPEAQARETVNQLASKGVPHSAVLNGERSAVTVEKKSKGFMFSREKRNDIANRAAQAKHQQVKSDTTSKQQELD